MNEEGDIFSEACLGGEDSIGGKEGGIPQERLYGERGADSDL